MMPSVPSDADEQAREVVAGARFARTPAGADDAAVGRDDGEARARSRASSRSARRWCPTRASTPCRRCVALAPGSIGKNRPVPLQLGVELLARDARLHAAVEILAVDLEHAVHPRQIDAHAAVQRRDVALERGADAERDHRHARRVAQPHDRGDLLVRLRKHDDVRQRRVGQAFAVTVLLAHRSAWSPRARRSRRASRVDEGRDVGGRSRERAGAIVVRSCAVVPFSEAGKVRSAAAGRGERACCRTRRSGASVGTALPGLSRPCGSNARLDAEEALELGRARTARTCRASFSTPTPCSPVIVPPTSMHSSRMRSPNASCARMLARACWRRTGSADAGCRRPRGTRSRSEPELVRPAPRCAPARAAARARGIVPSMQ